MRRIRSNIDPQSTGFRAFESHNRRLAAELHERQRKARFDRPQRDVQRLRKQLTGFHRGPQVLRCGPSPTFEFRPVNIKSPQTICKISRKIQGSAIL